MFSRSRIPKRINLLIECSQYTIVNLAAALLAEIRHVRAPLYTAFFSAIYAPADLRETGVLAE